MNPDTAWSRWFLLWSEATGLGERHGPAIRPGPSRAACPHCTNLDTLDRHCGNDRCGWSRCTCGAVIYGGRRHRHPRHGSGADTCHDPVAAA